MLACVHSALLRGIEAQPLIIEVDVAKGLPGFSLVGLPDSSVRESRERVFAALKHAGYVIPSKRITINLAPADCRKEGSSLDLPIAIALLAASEQVQIPRLEHWVIAGELALDGSLRPIRGALSLGLFAWRREAAGLVVPQGNADELRELSPLTVLGVKNLSQALAALQQPEAFCKTLAAETASPDMTPSDTHFDLDYREIRGQGPVLRALEVAAAGGHHFVMLGSPGCGKSMMVKRLPSVLPPMTRSESLEVTQIYDAAGLRSPSEGLMRRRPYRQPHHTVSSQALVGGGPRLLPGEASLAHHGLLFLDEWPEFPRPSIEALRQPLEDGSIELSRVSLRLQYPCRFMLGAAMNPCPCGYAFDTVMACTCQPEEIQRYRRRISGPMLDRIDMHIEVPRLSWHDLEKAPAGDGSLAMAERIRKAWERQGDREGERPSPCSKEVSRGENSAPSAFNARLSGQALERHVVLDRGTRLLLAQAVEEWGLSARAYDRIRRVARTIADLAGDVHVREEHVAEALAWRSLDRSVQPGWRPASGSLFGDPPRR